MYVADLETATPFASGPHVRAIGWLSAAHDYPRGEVTYDIVEKLGQFVNVGVAI